MRRIIKDPPPEFWTEYVRRHSKYNYDDLEKTEDGKQVRRQLREHMLLQQKKICCYCCRVVRMDNSHNEHIKPKDLFPKESMNYNNLLVSCTSKTCGTAKGNLYDSLNFVSPLQEECEEHFRFLPNGRIEGRTPMGESTIKHLNLNEYELVHARRAQYKTCFEMAKCMGKEYIFEAFMQEKDGCLPRFVDMITYFYERGDFDSDICAVCR